MKTFKLTTEKEILDMLESTLMINEAKVYLKELKLFFWNKSHALLNILVSEDKGEDCKALRLAFENSYETPRDLKQFQDFLEDYKLINDHLFFFDDYVNEIVVSQLHEPITVLANDNEALCLEKICDEYYDRFKDRFMSPNIMKVFHGTNLDGFKPSDELQDFEDYYELNEFKP